MAIFPHIELESTVQVGDRTRFDLSKSYVSKGEAAITLVEIDIDGGGFTDVTGTTSDDWYTDFEFATDGTKTITARITTDGGPITDTATIEVISEADDKLFSNDDDLVAHENDILKWLSQGRNTFLREHRRAQTLVVDKLADLRVYKTDGTELTKDDLIDKTQVKEWSTFLTLAIIFEGISNALDDIFAQKSSLYKSKAMNAMRSSIRADFDGSGDIGTREGRDLVSKRIYRR